MADRDDILKKRQDQEHLGVRWMLSDEAEQCNVSGVVRIVEDEKPDLQLLGTFSPGERSLALMNYSVVNGVSHGGLQGQVCIASSMYCVKGESEKILHGSESGC